MNEFTNEKERKGDDYSFCSYCNHVYGSDCCHNCTYYEDFNLVY